MKISKELYTLFKEWLEDATSDNPTDYVRNFGLCRNASFTSLDVYGELKVLFMHTLKGQEEFIEYPFGEQDYKERQRSHTMHLCPNRLTFVRKQIAKYEEDEH